LQKLQKADTIEEKQAAQQEVMQAIQKVHQQMPFGPGPKMWGFDRFDKMPFGAHPFFAPKPRLGAALQEPSQALADQLDLPQGQGLVVLDVIPGSPADQVGLKTNDILVKIDGKEVSRNVPQFNKMVAEVKEETPIDVVVIRKGKEQTLMGLTLPKREAPQVPFGPGFGAQDGVQMSLFRSKDRFNARYQEGSLIITVLGSVDQDNKAQAEKINVQDGAQRHKFNSIEDVPAEYREKVDYVMEAVHKGTVKIKIQNQ
jgi:membrane-associated protease RseP (regulator of RpoE activity)